jgi:iron complex outermembrane receptor protein
MALLVGGVGSAATLNLSVAKAADASDDSASQLQEVVVTGSRIASPNLDAISPVTAVSSEEIKSSGVTRIEDLVNSLPQVVADQGSGLSMGSTGIATINLRGLGAQRTLVLINGRRLMGGDPGAGAPATTNLGYGSAADVNQIPVALIERVDVLTGGASSTYGADAVAGVVNFIMNDHFEGVRVDANAGIYNHNNHEDWINTLLAARNFPTVHGTNWDGANKDFTLIMGHNFADDAGNFEGYLGYRREAPITADHRDHAACVLSTSSFAPYICGGSSNSAPAIFLTSGAPVQISPAGAFGPRYARYNYAATHYLQRIDERYTAGMFGHLKFNDHIEAYTEFMFMDDETRGNYAAAGLFFGSGFATDPATGFRNGNNYVNCGTGAFGNAGMNPYLTQSEFSGLCSPTSTIGQFYNSPTNPAPGDVQVDVGRRNIEGGPRKDQYSHTTYRGVFGAKGEIVPDWNYDASMTYGGTRFTDTHQNDTSSALMQNALLAVRDPVSGQIVCRGHQTGCVPWNIWNPALGVDPGSTAYFSVPGILQGESQEDILTAFITGDLTRAGVKLPTADDGLKVVLGTEYRRESVDFRPDQEFISADLSGIGSPTTGFDAAAHSWEGFAEMRMPLVRNLPFVKTLDFESGYRYSKYTNGFGFDTSTYKFGVEWAPVEDVRLRASYNRAARVPNLAELFKTPYVALDGGTDLCAPGTQYTAAQCALTGLNPALYNTGSLTSAAGQYNGQQGGSPTLVFTPSFLRGFSATIDYTDIRMTGVITTYGPNLIQQNCIADPTGVSATGQTWCAMIHRDSSGTLWASPQGYTIDPLINLNGLENQSFDLGLAYRVNLGAWGRLGSRLDGTYLSKLITTPGSSPSYNCAGRFGPSCEPVTPTWRHRLSADWDTPLSGISFGATWRFFGKSSNTLLDPKTPDYKGAAVIAANGRPPDAEVPTISYLDLRASYVWNKITLRAGVNNVLDKDPPNLDTLNTGGNSIYAESNTWPSVYDVAGRFLFVNATVDF